MKNIGHDCGNTRPLCKGGGDMGGKLKIEVLGLGFREQNTTGLEFG
jgi:hypothetical protein